MLINSISPILVCYSNETLSLPPSNSRLSFKRDLILSGLVPQSRFSPMAITLTEIGRHSLAH